MTGIYASVLPFETLAARGYPSPGVVFYIVSWDRVSVDVDGSETLRVRTP